MPSFQLATIDGNARISESNEDEKFNWIIDFCT